MLGLEPPVTSDPNGPRLGPATPHSPGPAKRAPRALLSLGGEDLEFFATPAFDQAATEQVINDLMALAVSHGTHQAADPRTGIGLAERNAALLEQAQDELKMLEFLDRNGVELAHLGKEVAI